MTSTKTSMKYSCGHKEEIEVGEITMAALPESSGSRNPSKHAAIVEVLDECPKCRSMLKAIPGIQEYRTLYVVGSLAEDGLFLERRFYPSFAYASERAKKYGNSGKVFKLSEVDIF